MSVREIAGIEEQTHLLAVEDLTVSVGRHDAVTRVGFALDRGRHVGLIGESGCGKTLTALAVMGLLPDGIRASGRVWYGRRDLLGATEEEMCSVRGNGIAMVFQEPMTALNPVMRVGDQIAEAILLHRDASREEAGRRALALLHDVRLPDAAERMRSYPHQLSGGQRQRVMIAMAIACEPDLLIADEPTTALDVTVQAQILRMLRRLVDERGMSLLLITHDLPVVAAMCEEVMVMYAGRIVERGPARQVFTDPRHPYTRGLVDAIPSVRRAAATDRRLRSIPGSVPSLGSFPSGCAFRDRCPRATEQCATEPALTGDERAFACWHPMEPAR